MTCTYLPTLPPVLLATCPSSRMRHSVPLIVTRETVTLSTEISITYILQILKEVSTLYQLQSLTDPGRTSGCPQMQHLLSTLQKQH